jgi:hypothetical protein
MSEFDVAIDVDLTLEERDAGFALAREVEAQRTSWSREDRDSLMSLLDDYVSAAYGQSLKAWASTLFFNHWSTDADFSFWSKASYWTLEEGLALAFGKDPRAVSWSTIRNYPKAAFVGRYACLRELAVRAKDAYAFEEKVHPGEFIAWVQQQEVQVPPELVAALEARGVPIANLKSLYEHEVAEKARLTKERDEVRREVDVLRAELAAVKELNAKLPAWEFQPESPTYPRELDAAVMAWWAISNLPETPANPGQALEDWLANYQPPPPNATPFSKDARRRIARVCNWNKLGGRAREKPKGRWVKIK